MFDHTTDDDRFGLRVSPDLSPEEIRGEDDSAYRITCLELADGWVDDDRDVLPDLTSISPGPFLAAILAGVRRARLNGFDLVETLKARERLLSHVQAEIQQDIVEVSHAAPGDRLSSPLRLEEAFDYASDEIRAALRLTRRSAEWRLSLATDLCDRLPGVLRLLQSGRIDWWRARVLCEGTAHLTIDEARAVVEELSDQAPRLTTGQLRARVRKLAVEIDPGKAVDRHERAREERRLHVEPTVDGTANLFLMDIPLHRAHAIRNRVHRFLISTPRLQRCGRTIDQLRADIATDLLLGHDPASGAGRGHVDLRVQLSTLRRSDDRAGLIDGLEPVTADIARQVADLSHDAEWRFTVLDDDGRVVHIGTTRRRPTKPLSRLVETLNPVCAGPGCRIPASQCDLDHLRPWSRGGETSSRNLGPKCRHDHLLRSHGWDHVRIDEQDVWTTPLGHTYRYPVERPP